MMMNRAFAGYALCAAIIVSTPLMAQHASSLYELETETLQGKPADLGAYRGIRHRGAIIRL